MSDPASPESTDAIPTLFFDWLEGRNDDIFLGVIDLSVQIDEQNLHGVFVVLDDIQELIRSMRDLSIVFDGYLDRHKQLMTSLNPDPKEGK